MNVRTLAMMISEALEDTVRVDAAPKVKKGLASLECEDDEGRTFIIRVMSVANNDVEETEGDASEAEDDDTDDDDFML